MTPTARTLAYLRRCGHAAEVVERFIAGAGEKGRGIRRDLFGCIDVVAVRRGEIGALGVQATTLANVSARLTKAQGRPELRTWLATGNRFSVFGWYRRAGAWRVKIVAIRAEDLVAVVVQAPRRRGRQASQGDLFAGVAQE